eukprot:superscaffoldBa00000055_g920
MFRLAHKGKVAARSPGGESDRSVVQADRASEDQKPFRMKQQQMVDEEAACMQAHRRLQGVEGQAGSPAAVLPLWVRQGGQRASGLSPTTLQHYQARAKHSARGVAWCYTSLIFSMYA